MSFLEKLLKKAAIKLAKKEAKEAYVAKCAKDLSLREEDVARVIDWLIARI